MPKFNPVQWALPLSAMFLFAGLYARMESGKQQQHDYSVAPGGGAAGGAAAAAGGSLNAQERAIILNKIKDEVSQAQQANAREFDSIGNRLKSLEQQTNALQSNSARPIAPRAAAFPPAQQQQQSAAGLPIGNGELPVQQCPGVPVVVPIGKAARTKKEVMARSKEDQQYGMGIVEERPDNLVNSKDYWETRYAMGGNSGAGSYNKIGVFKAKIMNNFVADNNIQHVIEFGFGDGQQLTRAKYPRYTGLDVSETIMRKTSKRFENDPAKHFQLYNGRTVPGLTADCTLSFDVIYHLVEDEVYHNYMEALFAMSTKYVVVYSSNIAGWHGAAHVLHRDVVSHIQRTQPGWKLVGTLQNDYSSRTAQDFFFYVKC